MRAPVGHDEQRTALHRLLDQKKLPSALLFAGPEGIGKRLCALELAASIFCERRAPGKRACGECSSCRLYESGNLPDLFKIDCADKEQVGVAEVRELLYSLNLKPFQGASRVVIMDNAEAMSIQSANALLKAVEEPRPGTHFILVSANPSKLPSTLLSRCQRWSFDLLEPDEVKEIVSRALPHGDDGDRVRELPIDKAVLLASGSIGNLLHLTKHHEEWESLSGALDLIAGGSLSEALSLADSLAKEKEKLRAHLHLMRTYARNRMLDAKNPDDQHRFAVFLENLVSADRLLFERNIAAAHLLRVVLGALASERPGQRFTRLTNGDIILEKLVP